MIVYSNRIVRFIREIKHFIKLVLSREVRLRVTGDRFYNREETISYPIKVVIYNNKSMLGYFNADFYELGFHERLMYSSSTKLQNLIRHELAHYLTYNMHGGATQPHGSEFRAFCELLGWGEDVYKATLCLEDDDTPAIEESTVLRKVQKLMALATSTNQHEAEQAMIKSQQLLLMHNIESRDVNETEDEKVFLKRIMKQKREDAKMRSIAKILETFFVSTVYSRAGGFTYLEILGSAVNVEIAEYVADVLHHELDRLWQQVGLRGTTAKNSFLLGLAKGYCNKVEALKQEYRTDFTNALMVIEKKLVDGRAMAYKHLSSRSSSTKFCQNAATLGEQLGRQLNITPAVSSPSKGSEIMLIR